MLGHYTHQGGLVLQTVSSHCVCGNNDTNHEKIYSQLIKDIMLIWEGFALAPICIRICGRFLTRYYIWLFFCDKLSQMENKSG